MTEKIDYNDPIFINKTINMLLEDRKKAKHILRSKPKKTAKYLVGTLSNPTLNKAVYGLLFDRRFKELEITSNFLVGSLRDEVAKPFAMQILKNYGASERTIYPVVNALSDLQRQGSAIDILLHYGPTNELQKYLAGKLSNKFFQKPIEDILTSSEYISKSDQVHVNILSNALKDGECRHIVSRILKKYMSAFDVNLNRDYKEISLNVILAYANL
jgi:hypothetical protein